MAETMTVCPSCSAMQNSGSNYCPKCGASVLVGVETPKSARQVLRAKYLILFGYCLVVAGLPMHNETGHYMIAGGFVTVFAGCQWLAVQ